MVLTNDPHVCHNGYQGTDTRPPQDGRNRPMNEDARCAEPASQSDARGAQNAPPTAPGAAYRSPVASYDPAPARCLGIAYPAPHWTTREAPPRRTLGEESWKWLFLQPLTSARR